MPSNAQVAGEYAEALFTLAAERGESREELLAGMTRVREALREMPRYEALLASPAIPARERVAAFREAFGQTLPPTLTAFLSILIESGRISLLGQIEQAFEGLVLGEKRTALAEVVCAAPLTGEEKQKLERALERRAGRQVRVSYRVDSSLLGGMRVTLDGELLDGSLRSKIESLRKSLLASE